MNLNSTLNGYTPPLFHVSSLDINPFENALNPLMEHFPIKIGEGNCGTVYRNLENTLALKLSKNPEANGLIDKEFEILQKIHHDQKIPEISRCPDRLINIDGIKGFVTKVFTEGNYKNYFNMHRKKASLKDLVLKDCRFFINCIKKLECLKIWHGDIKLQNVFVKKTKNGDIKYKLGDWGGVVTEQDLLKGECPTIAPNKTLLSDLNLFTIYSFQEKTPNSSSEKLVTLGQRINIFQAGLMIYHVVTRGQKAYQQNSKCCLVEKPNEDHLKSVPSGLRELILSMIHPIARKRPTASEAEDMFNKIIREEFGENEQTTTQI